MKILIIHSCDRLQISYFMALTHPWIMPFTIMHSLSERIFLQDNCASKMQCQVHARCCYMVRYLTPQLCFPEHLLCVTVSVDMAGNSRCGPVKATAFADLESRCQVPHPAPFTGNKFGRAASNPMYFAQLGVGLILKGVLVGSMAWLSRHFGPLWSVGRLFVN